VGLVASQQGTCYNPEIARAITGGRDAIRSICGVRRRAPHSGTGRHPVRALPFEIATRSVASVLY
ncbi:MAG: hypothetical protein ACT443_12190, partial [Gemmatimonadota bacterium]